jgi:type II secretory pathway component PulF
MGTRKRRTRLTHALFTLVIHTVLLLLCVCTLELLVPVLKEIFESIGGGQLPVPTIVAFTVADGCRQHAFLVSALLALFLGVDAAILLLAAKRSRKRLATAWSILVTSLLLLLLLVTVGATMLPIWRIQEFVQ